MSPVATREKRWNLFRVTWRVSQAIFTGIIHERTFATADENKTAETLRPLRVFFIAFSAPLRLFSQEPTTNYENGAERCYSKNSWVCRRLVSL